MLFLASLIFERREAWALLLHEWYLHPLAFWMLSTSQSQAQSMLQCATRLTSAWILPTGTQSHPALSPEQRPLDTQVHSFKEDPSSPERFHVYSRWTRRNPPLDVGSDLNLLLGKDKPPSTLRRIRSKATLLSSGALRFSSV